MFRIKFNKIMALRSFVVMLCSVLLLLDSSSIVIVALLIISSIYLFKEPEALIPLIFVTAISSSITVIPGIAGLFYYLYLVLFSCFLFKKKKINFSSLHILIVIYLFWIIITSYFSVTGETYSAFRLVVVVLPILLVSCYSLNSSRLLYYSLCMAIVSSIYIFFKLRYDPIPYIPDDKFIYYTTSKIDIQNTITTRINPNTLTQFSCLLYLILFVQALETKRNSLFLFCVFPFMVLLIVGSRTSFISMLVISFVMFVTSRTIKLRKKIVITFLGLFLSQFFISFILSSNSRLDIRTIAEDQGSGRFVTWASLAENVISQNFFTGIGFGMNNLTKLGYIYDGDNLYVDIFTHLGFIGFILFFAIIINLMLLQHKSGGGVSRLACSFLLFVFMVGIGETVFDTFMIWMIIFYSLFPLQNNTKEYNPNN